MPIDSGSMGFDFYMGRMPTTAGMTLVHRNTMDAIFMVTVIPAFFICPNAVKGIEDISNMKGRSNNESNRQAKRNVGTLTAPTDSNERFPKNNLWVAICRPQDLTKLLMFQFFLGAIRFYNIGVFQLSHQAGFD